MTILNQDGAQIKPFNISTLAEGTPLIMGGGDVTWDDLKQDYHVLKRY
jgi:hypothetical protein